MNRPFHQPARPQHSHPTEAAAGGDRRHLLADVQPGERGRLPHQVKSLVDRVVGTDGERRSRAGKDRRPPILPASRRIYRNGRESSSSRVISPSSRRNPIAPAFSAAWATLVAPGIATTVSP
jgi:hypothetical protein